MANDDINLCKVCYVHEGIDPHAVWCPRAGFWQIIALAWKRYLG